MGHDYGLFWLQQAKGSGGERTWTKQTIDNSVASVHALIWADIDGDGKAHELVTGKRVYAHEIEPGATDGSLIAWYAFDPATKNWIKHVIFQGEPAKNAPAKGADRLALKDFPPGTAGTGLQLTAIDIDRDGDLDLVCPGKSGLLIPSKNCGMSASSPTNRLARIAAAPLIDGKNSSEKSNCRTRCRAVHS